MWHNVKAALWLFLEQEWRSEVLLAPASGSEMLWSAGPAGDVLLPWVMEH